MGCWSEACGFSGMEIPEHTPTYVVLVKPHKYNEGWVPTVPPTKGLYNDYGGIELLEDNSLFGLVKGETWDCTDDKRGQPVYIHADVFEWLPNIRPEFPSVFLEGKSQNAATIGIMRDLYLADWKRQMQERTDFVDSLGEEDPTGSLARSGVKLMHLYLGNIFGVSEGLLDGAAKIVEAKLDARETNLDEFWEFYGRCYTYIRGQGELRKLIVPGFRGPQHGGEQALVPFYRHVLDLSMKRIEKWKSEDKDYDPGF